MVSVTLYEVLGIAQDADAQAVKSALRAQLRATHPDTTGVDSHVQFDLVRRAGDVLTDPERRAAYDASLTAPASDPWAPSPAPRTPRPPQPAAGWPPPPAQQAPPTAPEPQWVDPGGLNASRNTAIWLAAAAVLIIAGHLLTFVSDRESSQLLLLGAAAAAITGAVTWRRGGWALKPMLVVNAGAVMLALLVASRGASDGLLLEHLAEPRSWVPAAGVLLVTAGIDAATWRLTSRRRVLYRWETPGEE